MNIKISNQEFINAVFSNLPDGSFIWANSINKPLIRGNLTNADWNGSKGKGKQLPKLDEGGNTYFCLSSIRPDSDGAIARCSENFASLHVVVCDDVGTKAHLPNGIQPSYMLETSPGNFQVGFLLDTPLTDLQTAKAIFSRLAELSFTDDGAQGPQSRYMRLPIGRNTKPQYGGSFEHQLKSWNPERKFTVREIDSMLGLNLDQLESKPAPKIKARPQSDDLEQDDLVIIAKILHSPKGKRLWYGNDVGFGSGSDADQALLTMIAYHTLDPDQIEAIYSQSDRSGRTSSDGTRKWETRPDYRKASIEKAIRFVEANPHVDIDDARDTVEAALVVAKESGDIRSIYAEDVLQAFAVLEQGDIGNFDYLRSQAKKAGASITNLDKAIKQAAEQEKAMAHAVAADAAIAKFGNGNLVFSMPSGSFWQWRQELGIWIRLNSDEPIKQSIHAVLPEPQINAGTVSSVFQVLKTKIAQDISFDRPAGDFVVNCANGELHLKDVSFDQGLTGIRLAALKDQLDRESLEFSNPETQDITGGGFWDLKPHTREHFHTSAIPVAYDPAARCPRFDQFLNEVFDGDDDAESKIRLVWMAIAYSLFPTTQLEKFFLLYGPSASNGKSTLLQVLEWIVGKDSASALSLKQLGERFAPANLQGKLINLCAEIPMGQTLPDEEIKRLVSGDVITAEFKGKNHFEFRSYATLWFASNNLPHSRDVSPATIQKRCILVSFNRSFNGEDRDLRLKDKLKEELPGILAYALGLFGGLLVLNREQGHDLLLEEPPSSIAAKAEWLISSDPVRQFVEDRIVAGSDYFITSKEAYSSWETWRDESGSKSTITSRQLTDALKRQFGNRIQTGDNVRQNGKRGILGLALRPD